MKKTAEAVSLGHPDKISDYISSYVLDRMIEMDAYVKYAVEVLVKDNTVVLGGEISGNVDFTQLDNWVKDAIREIGYDERYNKIWGDFALNINKINVVNMIGLQSPDINRGIQNNGWGDQGVFVGYACRGVGMISRELYLARKINNALYNNARRSDNLGLDIKTQVTIDDNDEIDTVVVAIPMLHPVDLSEFIVKELGGRPKKLIINGTGVYQYHSSVAAAYSTGMSLKNNPSKGYKKNLLRIIRNLLLLKERDKLSNEQILNILKQYTMVEFGDDKFVATIMQDLYQQEQELMVQKSRAEAFLANPYNKTKMPSEIETKLQELYPFYIGYQNTLNQNQKARI